MKYLLLLILLFSGTISYAEYRIWSDLKGNCIEAKLLDASPAQVSIQDKKGKVYKFHPTKLSLSDQTYLKTAFPPDLEIEFSKVQDRQKSSSYYHADVTMSGRVVVKAQRYTEYKKTMKVVLVMIGQEQSTDSMIILNRAEGSFDFMKVQEFELKGASFKMHEDKYDNSYGTKYKGYLAVVLDSEDKALEIKASRKEYTSKYEKIIKLKSGDCCSKDFDHEEGVRTYY